MVKTKVVRLIIIILILMSCNNKISDQELELKIQIFFEKHLSVIEKFHNEKDVDGNEIEEAREFLEEITKIESEAEYGFTGAYPPTELDLKKWKEWYSRNKDNLIWDEKNQNIKLKN